MSEAKTKVVKIEPSPSGTHVRVTFEMPNGHQRDDVFTPESATVDKLNAECRLLDEECDATNKQVDELKEAFGLSSSLVESEGER